MQLTSTVKTSPTKFPFSLPLKRSRLGTYPPLGCLSLTRASAICKSGTNLVRQRNQGGEATCTSQVEKPASRLICSAVARRARSVPCESIKRV